VTREQHRQEHLRLHEALDQLMADFFRITGKRPSTSTVGELMRWSYEQTQNPTVPPGAEPHETETTPR
jgi:hypothetical protein